MSKVLGVYSTFSVAVVVPEMAAARGLQRDFCAADSYIRKLQDEAYADLGDDLNFERLFATLAEPQAVDCARLK